MTVRPERAQGLGRGLAALIPQRPSSQPGVTEIGCDRESRYCTAMVEVLPGLMAV